MHVSDSSSGSLSISTAKCGDASKWGFESYIYSLATLSFAFNSSTYTPLVSSMYGYLMRVENGVG
jgi:hypothetical protein